MELARLTNEALGDLYALEAEYLDAGALHQWLDLLTPDIDYRVPVRVVREKASLTVDSDFTDRGHFLWEDLGSLRTRVLRLESEFAWAEQPPTRTRRLVTNLRRRPAPDEDNGAAANTRVLTNFAVYCYRGDSPTPVILTGERDDRVRSVDGELRISRRLVRLDSNVLGMHSLSIFL